MLDMLKKVLSYPFFYKLFQNLVRGSKEWKILQKEYIKSDKNMRILDLCCGTADILPYLEFSEYTGVDLSDKYINHDKKKYKNVTNASFILADVNNWLKKNESQFDIILMIGGMQCLNDIDLTEMLKNIQVSLPDSKFVFVEGCFESHLSKFERMLLENNRGKNIRTKEVWLKVFTDGMGNNYEYVIRKDLEYLPFNQILFYR